LLAQLPLVSVIVPTRNSGRFLETCLTSIRQQTYPNIELIVIDNHSTDSTLEIANRYADSVFSAGPERSAQVNRGVELAKGSFVYRVDADFLLDPEVVSECVRLAHGPDTAVIVHNTPDSTVSWIARVRKFEVDMYKYSITHSAARFLPRELFLSLGGLRTDVTSGEDYDFQNRLLRNGIQCVFADSEAVHLDEPSKILPILKKYYKYGQDFPNYRRYNKAESKRQLAFFRRDYLTHWRNFLLHPVTSSLFLTYHSLKFLAGGTGYLKASLGELLRRASLRRPGHDAESDTSHS
jgi:glycosyltransferase involved in cell wall biosynthesis